LLCKPKNHHHPPPHPTPKLKTKEILKGPKPRLGFVKVKIYTWVPWCEAVMPTTRVGKDHFNLTYKHQTKFSILEAILLHGFGDYFIA
jgi:hypothetical protein